MNWNVKQNVKHLKTLKCISINAKNLLYVINKALDFCFFLSIESVACFDRINVTFGENSEL